MSAAIGIKAQPSRFAVLMKDSDSDDNESELKTKSRPNSKGVTKPNKKSEPAAVKNAKKRARKKKNQLKGNQHEETHEPAEANQEDIPAQLIFNDDAFQKDLQEALLISKLEMEQKEQQLAVEEHFKELKKSKKGVKLTLQELHSGEYENTVSPTTASKQWPVMPLDDKNFFEDLSVTVQEELQKEKSKVTGMTTQSQQANTDESHADVPRIADLKFQLEKRDNTISDLEASIDKLNNELEEVKRRNQALCKILSKGEFSTKTELLEQVEQLISERDELALENGELHKALEQEKSKNKHLTQELTKFQGSRQKTSSTSSTT